MAAARPKGAKAESAESLRRAKERDPTRPLGALPRAVPRSLVAVLALTVVACASAPQPEVPTIGCLEEWRRPRAEGASSAPGGAAERAALDRFRELFGGLKPTDFEARLRAVYVEDVWFDDTLQMLRGLDAVVRYLAKTADALESGSAEVLDVAASDGDHYGRWDTRLRFARFDRGTTRRSVGVSHLRFDREGKVVLHQDFWDASRGLFEHVPGRGWPLKRAKRRL